MRAAGALLAIIGIAAATIAMAQQPGRPAMRSAQPAVPVEPSEEFSVGIVDIPAILRQSTATLGLQRQLQVEQEKYQSMADQLQRNLQAEEEALERQRTSLSPEAYGLKSREFQDKVNRTTSEFRSRRRQIDEAFNAASGEINRTLLQVIEELAKERKIELIVRREAVVYLQAGEDLTQAAGEALNKRLPEIKVEIPPAPQ